MEYSDNKGNILFVCILCICIASVSTESSSQCITLYKTHSILLKTCSGMRNVSLLNIMLQQVLLNRLEIITRKPDYCHHDGERWHRAEVPSPH